MGLLLDSFWRAAAYCLHPRVIALSFLPLIVMVAIALGAGWLWWDGAVDAVFRWLESYELISRVGGWLVSLGFGGLRTVMAPLIVIFLATPVIVVGSIVAVAVLMAPALVHLVGERRFPALEKKRGGSVLASIAWSIGSSLLALIALVISLPLWLIPPLILVLPPLIWGWLTYRVMAFDALAEHASKEERRLILKRHRWPLLGIGVLTGYLGAAPSIVWASGALFAAAFVILVPVAIWIYTVVFAFSSLWFAHYALAALALLRQQPIEAEAMVPVASRDDHSR
ncbi:EI24 domain-containing protein [Ramlibacter humi]|uniref:EI24 domain-containing protein n=1 Tax=Ramlibacter humi TaxID=2530451 RepID=A0A4Z0BPA8_9BURK|nr:EI24 domain-containing protein [Ramlibacter humi]TFZ00250.1 EI24 domain-containing protein [Ramlibacter humi]